MELKIDINAQGDVNRQLCITDERVEELLAKMNLVQDQFDGKRVYKAEVFKALIHLCDTLEECVLVVHTYTNYINQEYGIK